MSTSSLPESDASAPIAATYHQTNEERRAIAKYQRQVRQQTAEMLARMDREMKERDEQQVKCIQAVLESCVAWWPDIRTYIFGVASGLLLARVLA